MRLPLSKHAGEGTDLIGHNAAVLSASWSHDGTMVLTASADRTARMWNAACAQPLLQFSHVQHQVRGAWPREDKAGRRWRYGSMILCLIASILCETLQPGSM